MAQPAGRRDGSDSSQPLLLSTAPGYGTGEALADITIYPEVLARAMQFLTAAQRSDSSITATSVQHTLPFQEGQYVGDIVDGVPHGRGTLTYPPGAERKKYDGEWKNGKFEGRGVLLFSNGARFEGQWKFGLLHGHGIQVFSDGGQYEGGLIAGKSHGKGTMRWANGSSYTGDWVNDKQHGTGTYRYSDGSEYSGGWCEGNKSGQGKMSWPSGNYYQGEWYENNYNGRGFNSLAYGYEEGEFRKGKLWLGKRVVNGTIFTCKDGVSSSSCSCSIM